jgi:integrase
VSAALAGLSRPRPPGDGAGDLWRYLDPAFLAGAGWNPETRTLAPPPGHPLLGYRLCVVRACVGQGLAPHGFCATCHKARRQSGLSAEKFIAAGPVRAKRRGEVICSAQGCPRPVRTSRLRLCYTHEHRRRQLGLPLAVFLQHPRAQPLPGFGRCKVAVCTRQAHARRGLCRAHDVRWLEQHGTGAVTAADFGAWCQSSALVASGHEAVMRGLAPLVQAQILFGLQERCRQGALTLLSQLRIICRRLLAAHAQTIAGFDDSRFARQHRALARDLQQAVLLAGTSPEDECRKDIWNTVVLGHGRRRVIDFTGISQTWLRESVKRWAAEELPARRGDHATAILQSHVRRAGELSASLRLHRDDHGDDPSALGRGDIIAFLSRLSHRQATGQISSCRRSTTCRQVAMILRECRVLGLARPGMPMSGLPDDFTVRRDDIPQQAADDEPGRALPAGVLNQLIAALPLLETSAGPAVRAAVELFMDTGRRPTEICKLGWDCLDLDPDGKYALIYTDFKANRAGRRLPVTGETAKVVIGQQERVRARYPDTPASELALFPRSTRNRDGKRPVVDSGSQGPGASRAQGLHHQPADLPRRHPHHRRVRDQRLPPAVRDREIVPDVQARPPGPAHLPPPARLHRGPPDHRLRRPRHQPLDRSPNRLVHPQVRPHRPPLPHHRIPDRRPHHHRRRPPARRPPRRPRPHPPPFRSALICHNSGRPIHVGVYDCHEHWGIDLGKNNRQRNNKCRDRFANS